MFVLIRSTVEEAFTVAKDTTIRAASHGGALSIVDMITQPDRESVVCKGAEVILAIIIFVVVAHVGRKTIELRVKRSARG